MYIYGWHTHIKSHICKPIQTHYKYNHNKTITKTNKHTYDASLTFDLSQVDVFTLMAMDLGQLRKLQIRHDNKQASAGWYLERVEIVDMKEEAT